MVPVKRALVSVSDKTGLVHFCRELKRFGVEIVSTGGTARVLNGAGISVLDVAKVTGFPEMMDGRVKTLHPLIHGGILGLRDNPIHVREAERAGIQFIDLLVVNLYPFQQTIEREEVSVPEAIEEIDIGGPAMVRAGAKNYEHVTVIVDPNEYRPIIEEISETGGVSFKTRKRLAVKAFRHTANYDGAIDTYLSRVLLGEDVLRLQFTDGRRLRYGENWHQKAELYIETGGKSTGPSLARARQLHGKQMSYNNYVDSENAMQTIKELEETTDQHAAVVVKHNNPCGLATGNTQLSAIRAAWTGDQISAFGSVLCFNKPLGLEAAEFLKGRFVEVILAPGFEPDALTFLQKKSRDLRLLELPDMSEEIGSEHTYHHITGGVLRQTMNRGLYEKWETVTVHEFPKARWNLARFAIAACKHTKSNAVVIGCEYEPQSYALLGAGAGQPNRVDSIRKLALTKAEENIKTWHEQNHVKTSLDEYGKQILSESVLASDAFFPFPDSITHSAEAGIRYIVSPGGSIRDDEVIAEAERLGVSMIFTGMRHFSH
ncbi:bifunctional phosphoribosylaminoimidazolecarboxamide formyltransferase/inosine monophosphate cyclohydrolase [Methanosarcinales archaeon ex4572_44]|nr:MAG: bifunctional phosphoribosylaminoimidazolecarboxamide formyltransferase/inosine monophosphate cyclohydrolase [Methanosarcinales archaeon ex4572_44]